MNWPVVRSDVVDESLRFYELRLAKRKKKRKIREDRCLG